MADKLSRSIIFKGFRKVLISKFGETCAAEIWQDANTNLASLERWKTELDSDSRMMILPAAALYRALQKHTPEQALLLLTTYGTQMGEKIAQIVHSITSIPGLPKLLWKHMPKLMRITSSPEKGYTRRIVSETRELVGVDILSCPLHDAAVKIGVPEAALVVCAMDKAYMTGFSISDIPARLLWQRALNAVITGSVMTRPRTKIEVLTMKALTYIEHGKFALTEKPKPEILDPRDAVVRVTLGSICTSDLHIKHGSVPRAVPGITVGHEMVGVVESVGSAVTTVKPGDRVTVNVETFCGECFFCQHGFVNNCTDPDGGWALGCRIDGGQAEFVRVPYADQGLNKIPDTVSDEQALFVGDVLATGFWAARISEITEDDTVLIIGAGPTGICTLLCVMLKNPKRIIVCEKDPARIAFVREHYSEVLVCEPESCKEFTLANSDHGGADVVLEVAGAKDTFRLAWDCARPNAIVTVVALYDEPQILPFPDMYGKNLTFKTGGVDGCDCAEILALIEAGKINTTPLITHRYKLEDIEEAYRIFENKLDGVIKIAVEP